MCFLSSILSSSNNPSPSPSNSYLSALEKIAFDAVYFIWLSISPCICCFPYFSFTFSHCLAVFRHLQFQKRLLFLFRIVLLFLFRIVFSKLILHCYGRLPWDVFHRTLLHFVLVFSVADPGCLSRIRFFSSADTGSKFFPSSRKYDPGCSSRIQGSKRRRIPDPQHCWYRIMLVFTKLSRLAAA
jgi:hypothetical protein